MKCPHCGYTESKVIDSRPTDEYTSIRRRRECLSCQRRFTTYEIVDHAPLMVQKKDGSLQMFDRSKVLAGMIRACDKLPVSRADLEQIVHIFAAAGEFLHHAQHQAQVALDHFLPGFLIACPGRAQQLRLFFFLQHRKLGGVHPADLHFIIIQNSSHSEPCWAKAKKHFDLPCKTPANSMAPQAWEQTDSELVKPAHARPGRIH